MSPCPPSPNSAATSPPSRRHTYLNAAAASPTPRPVRAAVEPLHRQLEEDGDIHWDAWLERKEEVRATVARLINAEPDEIAFVPNTSTGINLIVDLLEHDGDVVSDTLEFPTVTLPWVHRGVTCASSSRARTACSSLGRLRPRRRRPAPRRAQAAPVPAHRRQPAARGTRSTTRRRHAPRQPRPVQQRLPAGPRRLRRNQGRGATSSSAGASPPAPFPSTCDAAASTRSRRPDTSGCARATARGSATSP